MKKIVIAGANAYHFAPSVLEDLLIRFRIPCELWLVDADTAGAELTARAARALAGAAGCDARFFFTASWEKAIPGADAVVVTADFLDEASWKKDVEMLEEVGLGKQCRLLGGLGGLMQTLRAAGWVADLAEEMRARCPEALLILCDSGYGGLALSRACETASRVFGIRTYGVSGAAEQTAKRLSLYLGLPEERLEVSCAGLNGFSWVTRLRDRETGADLIPRCMKEMAEDPREALSAQYADWYGAIPAGWRVTQHEFLADTPASPNRTAIYSGVGLADAEIRKKDLAKVAVYGPEREPGKGAWERIRGTGLRQARPAEMLNALWGGEPCRVPSLSFPDDGAVPGVPAGRFCEAPARLGADGAHGEPAALPAELEDVLARVSLCNLLYASAAAGNRDDLREGLEIDPALAGVDLLYAEDLLDRMMTAEKEKLHRFNGEE